MDRRFLLFLMLSCLLLFANIWWIQFNTPAEPTPLTVEEAGRGLGVLSDMLAAEISRADRPAVVAAGPERLFTLGSADPESKYRMLVVLNSKGAAIQRLTLNDPRYLNLDDYFSRQGFLGFLEPTDPGNGGGAVVNVVGPGTPAAAAGLQVGDMIFGARDAGATEWTMIDAPAALEEFISGRKIGATIELTVVRNGQPLAEPLTATLGARPVEVMRPEDDHPLSMLLQLTKVSAQAVEEKDLDLRTANWTIPPQVQLKDDPTPQPNPSPDRVVFSATFGDVEVLKSYRLAEVADDQPAYHLVFQVELRNHGEAETKIVYQLDGPTGMPTEGWWYGRKVSRHWSMAGEVDVVHQVDGYDVLISAPDIVAGDAEDFTTDADGQKDLDYIMVDARYFAAGLIPHREEGQGEWIASGQGRQVGDEPDHKYGERLANISFRVETHELTLPPGEAAALHHRYLLFAGPKDPDLLGNQEYQLKDLIYYGWPIFTWVAKFMVWLLGSFYSLVGNYGLAIIMLTVLVRLCMFPLSKKQALSAQKMQMLQPELRKIAEKYKKKPEERIKAQRELFQKHNYNPFGGCLLIFIQLPIFVGLYKALSVSVTLRQQPLIPGIRWASDLSAPDRLFRWDGFMPDFLGAEYGWLGPYFNILPIITIALFMLHQKLFMPPPTDEQQIMQRKIMSVMMIFFGFMFFTVPSGLCLYFIASSLWGIAERKLLPKMSHASDGPTTTPEEDAATAAAERREAARERALEKKADNRSAGNGRAGYSKKRRPRPNR